MPGQTKVIISWADDIEEDDDYGPYGGDDLPPPTSKVEGNIKIVTSYKREDGKKFKIINHYKIERIKVSKAVASRKQWKKFGKAREDPPASSLSVATPKPTKVVNADESDTLPSQKSPTENTTESGLSVSSVDRRFRIKVRKTTRPSSTESNKKEITVAPTVQFQSSENATYNTTLLPADKKQLDDYSKEESNELNTSPVDEKEFNTRGLNENGNITSSSLSPSSITDVSNPSFSLSSNSSSDLLNSSTTESMSTTETSLTSENQDEDNFVNQTTTSIPPAPQNTITIPSVQQNTTSILPAPQNETVDSSMEESSNNDITASPVSSISERNATIIEASISISGPSKSSKSGALNNLNNFWLLVNLVSLSLILICL